MGSFTPSQAIGAILSHQQGQSRPAPSLAWTADSSADEEGYCGNFFRRREWTVTNGAGGGVIIQKVTRAFNVERYTGPSTWVSMSGSDIDGYIQRGSSAHAMLTTYWEAWEVDSSGDVVDNGDGFGLCSIISSGTRKLRTTRGTFVITGEAAFYPTIRASALGGLGFSMLSNHPANGLMATNSPPALSGHTGYAATNYTVTVTWDSDQTKEDDCFSDVR
jgi:hypothetical protein